MTFDAAGHFARVSGGLLCLIVAALPARGALPERYAISNMTSAVAPSQKIGKIKQGFICAPKGSLKFGDLQRADEERLRRRISELGLAQGLVIELPDSRFPSTTASSPLALVGRLENISLNLCVPGANIGIGNRKSKGAGSMTVSWEVWRRNDKLLVAHKTLDLPIEILGDDPRQSSEALEEHLARSAMQFLDETKAASGQ